MDEIQTGVEVAGEAVLQTEQSQTAEVQTGVEILPEAGGDEKAPDANTAWEKRIASIKEKAAREAREQVEKELSEKYKDYELHKELSAWAQERTGTDAMSLKEQIEMERLQERAEQQGITPEMQKRLEALEQKAALADRMEQERSEEQRVQTYFTSLNDFMKDKQGDSQALNQFMIDNGLTYDPNNPERSFGVAYKAMIAEQLEQELATAKETAIKEYLQSKTAPRVEGSGTPGITQVDTSKMDWKDIRNHTLARLQAANQST